MLKTLPTLAALLLLLALPTAQGQDYSVETIPTGPDAEAIPADLAGVMSNQGLRVNRGTRTAAEIWFTKQWTLDASFEGSASRLYPFSPGQLIGVVHFGRRGSDFRDQPVSGGWYTLRFGLQPVDGNHEGTSPTRDFLLLVDASQDAVDKEWDQKELYRASADAAGTTHPAMLCMQPAEADAGNAPAMKHDDFNDWWILRAQGKGLGANNQPQDVAVELVVVGHAME